MITHKLADAYQQRCDWASVRAIAPNLLDGEDAQQWVSRGRQESDEHRERQWLGEQ